MENNQAQKAGHFILWVALAAIAVICGGFWFGLS